MLFIKISNFKGFKNLETLILRDNMISKIERLEQLNNLKELLEVLDNLHQLKRLYLCRNKINLIESLEKYFLILFRFTERAKSATTTDMRKKNEKTR